ncbi:MAG: FAD-binding domain-containing protein [Pseudomonadota bacterium]
MAESTRTAGLRRLDEFVSSAGARYSKSRNFDFGPTRRGNVSMLSPYVRHRLVLEDELLERVLQQHSLTAANKFVQEVFWRTYFKGWLEHHPSVWAHYRQSVSHLIDTLDDDAQLLERYNTAVEGNTGIDCFDAWIHELVTHGYLHNHARMWFASIWVFTLELPWQLGADLFYRHLIDGDPASNTLGWRWVCGLHTRGKTYLARVSNIANYTDKRFSPHGKLATNAPALHESRVFPLEPLSSPQVLQANERFGLLVTEEDGCPISLLDDQVPVTVLGASATGMRSSLPVGTPATEFANGALADAVERLAGSLDIRGELSTSDDWGSLLVEWATNNRLDTIATAYAPVGPVAEMLTTAGVQLERYGIRLLQLRRPYDSMTWPHAQRGYFKLKNKIPELLERLQISHSFDETQNVMN